MDGTVIVPVQPQDSPPRKSKKKGHRKKRAREGYHHQEQENSVNEPGSFTGEKERESTTEAKLRALDEETMGELEENGLSQPY